MSIIMVMNDLWELGLNLKSDPNLFVEIQDHVSDVAKVFFLCLWLLVAWTGLARWALFVRHCDFDDRNFRRVATTGDGPQDVEWVRKMSLTLKLDLGIWISAIWLTR
jgi:hypothetical protein